MKESTSADAVDSGKVGSCILLFGTVKAVSATGDMRTLYAASPVFMDDHIMTGLDGLVSIKLDDAAATRIDLGRMSEIVLNDEVVGVDGLQDRAAIIEEVEQIQSALIDGDIDPTLELKPAAAGDMRSGNASAGGGIKIARFNLVGQEVVPGFTGAETTGIALVYSVIDPTILAPLASDDPMGLFSADAESSSVISGTTFVTEAVPLSVDSGTVFIAALSEPQDAILVDEAGNSLVASLRVSYDNELLSMVELTPLDEFGNPVESGQQVFEDGEPLVLDGAQAFWQMGENGAWSVVVRRPDGEDNDTEESDGHDDHEKPTEMDLVVSFDSQEYVIHVSGYDELHGVQGGGWLHANGQGLGVGNPFINMDATGSELITFDFSSLVDDLQLYKVDLGIDHLSGAHGNKPAEQAVWKTYDTDGDIVETDNFIGSGQGSGGADQVLEIVFGEYSGVTLLEMSYNDPTGEEGAEEVCGQGYRISSINGFDIDGNELFSFILKKSESGSDHDDGHDEDPDSSQGVGVDQDLEPTYIEEVIFTVYPEMDSTGTMYTGNYVVYQNASFHDNSFSFSLTGGEGGKLEEKVMNDGDMTLVVTATDPDAHGASVVKGNGQGLGVGNPFVDMDSEGSECLHFAFMDANGDYHDMIEVTLVMDHLSGGTGGHSAEYAKWEAFVIDDNGEKLLVGSDIFAGEGQGSGWQSDQELNIKLIGDDGTPIFFNSLDLSVASEEEIPPGVSSGKGHESTSSEHDHSELSSEGYDMASESEHGTHDEQEGEDDEGACGQGFRVGSIEGVYDPGDHVFDIVAVVEDGAGNEATVVFDVTFDGDGYVQGGSEDEVIAGSTGDDFLNGGGGDDIIIGGDGDDILLGEDGNDELSGGGDMDVVIGGAGEDAILGDDPGNPDNAMDVFNGSEVASGEVGDYDGQEDVIYAGDPLENLVPLDPVV